MRESVFIKQNISKWHDYEYRLSHGNKQTPPEISEIYLDLSSDLAFAQTHYPNAEITSYLNDLTLKLHNQVYKEKHENWHRIITFWTREVPEIVWRERKSLIISLTIFLVAMAIGIFSTINDDNFIRLIMGDEYVDMTLNNIKNGTPMDVYAHDLEAASFANIMFNNVGVSLLAFTFGIFTSIAVGYFLFSNGVMIGSFFAFLYSQGVLADSWSAIMLHGTLELSAIVIAGGAGIAFGNGWLFPGSYSRITALKQSAKRGLKIVFGTIPVFVLAAFIEGFFTRHFEWPSSVKYMIIGVSALFVIFYYIIYPYIISHHERQ